MVSIFLTHSKNDFKMANNGHTKTGEKIEKSHVFLGV